MARSKAFGRTKTLSVLALYLGAMIIVGLARIFGIETREEVEEFIMIVITPLGLLLFLGVGVILLRKKRTPPSAHRASPIKRR